MAQRGGGRPGAGRKKGSPNKSTLAHKKKIAESGLSPLDYMLGVLRDESEPQDRRMDAAKAAAPYVHPRLAAVEMTGRDGGPIQTEETSARAIVSSKLARIAARSAASGDIGKPK